MIEGTLQNLPFADVVQVIATGQKSGLLELRGEAQHARLSFSRGRVCSAQLTPGLHLGEVLVRMELLTALEVQELLERQRRPGGPPLGRLALEAGLVGPHELERAVRSQLTDALTELCGWRSGSFAFRDHAGPAQDAACQEPFDTLSLLMDAAQRLAESQQGSVPEGSVFMRSGDPTLVQLPGGGWEVLGYVDGRRNAASIAAELDVSARQVYRLLFQLLEVGVIEPSPYPAQESAVLIIAQDAAVLRLIQLSLQRAGLRTLAASSFEAGLETLRQVRPRALVIDDQAGEGQAFIRTLGRAERPAHLPTVLLTGKAQQPGRWQRARQPQVHSLPKPFAELELQQLVTRLVGRGLS